MKRSILFLLFSSSLFMGNALAASFDCTKAKSFAEKTICSDDKLSGDDEILAKVYSMAKRVAHNKKGFGILTKELWNSREGCSSYRCVADWYDSAFVVYDSVIKTNASDDLLNDIQNRYDKLKENETEVSKKESKKSGAKDFSLYDSKERAAPVEHKAILYKDTPEAFKFIDTLVGFVRQSSYKCDSVSSFIPMMMSNGFTLSCNNFRYKYEIKDNGGRISVTVDN